MHSVCRAGDLPVGEKKIVAAGGESIRYVTPVRISEEKRLKILLGRVFWDCGIRLFKSTDILPVSTLFITTIDIQISYISGVRSSKSCF